MSRFFSEGKKNGQGKGEKYFEKQIFKRKKMRLIFGEVFFFVGKGKKYLGKGFLWRRRKKETEKIEYLWRRGGETLLDLVC